MLTKTIRLCMNKTITMFMETPNNYFCFFIKKIKNSMFQTIQQDVHSTEKLSQAIPPFSDYNIRGSHSVGGRHDLSSGRVFVAPTCRMQETPFVHRKKRVIKGLRRYCCLYFNFMTFWAVFKNLMSVKLV